MRKTLAAVTMILVLGVAGAASRDDQTPEGQAYLGFSFGGQRAQPRDFHYGLRLDQDSRFYYEDGRTLPPIMQFDYTTRGLNDARVNGLSILKKRYRMQQAEGEVAAEGAEAAAAEEPGFFGRIGNWFSNLFGGDDEEEAPAEGESAEAPVDDVPPGEVAEGVFMGYSAVDWGMLAAGALGIGFIASEVAGGEEDSDEFVLSHPGGTGGTTGTVDPCEPTGGFDPVACGEGTGAPLISLAPFSRRTTLQRSDLDPEVRERMEWLDGGTGHMGDLQEQHD